MNIWFQPLKTNKTVPLTLWKVYVVWVALLLLGAITSMIQFIKKNKSWYLENCIETSCEFAAVIVTLKIKRHQILNIISNI